jgi:serine-type D-Ala-D-Ala carboxypeptidase/endopeptidase (penicillin-binding protein 4)
MKVYLNKMGLMFFFLVPVMIAFSQDISSRLDKAYLDFEKDPQLKNAISSLYVIDAKTGQVVFEKNAEKGLAPASTQKILTSVTAFELLGPTYRYKTEIGYIGDGAKKDLCIKGAGDPTLGSWRWENTKEENFLKRLRQELAAKNLANLRTVIIIPSKWESDAIPDGWIWQDIGNYYGAAPKGLNWRENQFDIHLKSGTNIGDPVIIGGTTPKVPFKLVSEVKSAARGTGDNAYIYFPPLANTPYGIIKGTIPVNEEKFTISGSLISPESQLGIAVLEGLKDKFGKQRLWTNVLFMKEPTANYQSLYTEFSPSLDSIIYWFNKKSINLYGEALVQTFAYEKQGFGRTDSGVAIVRRFWKEKGLDQNELNIYDGSGLSPLNRVTTHAQVEILKYARTREWFPYLYASLPEFNGMKIKSGTISDVKSFCGYHIAKDGKEYIFSFIVNNYSGSASGLVGKMFKVLDLLK